MEERQLKNLEFNLTNEIRDKIDNEFNFANSNINTMDMYFPKRIHYSINEYIDFPYGEIHIPKNYITNIDDGEYEIITSFYFDLDYWEKMIKTDLQMVNHLEKLKSNGFIVNYIEKNWYEVNFGVTTIKNGVLDLKQFDSLFRNWKELDNHIFIETMSKVSGENKIKIYLGS